MVAENKKQNGFAPSALRVVAMGGGTGLSTLLKGLKRYVKPPGEAAPATGAAAIAQLSAVVTVTDDGGSSGRLRREFNILPPGDIRNCIVALSEDEALLSRLFQYRFASGKGLEGHNFGNLFVAALTAVTGDFAQAVKLSSEVLATRGHIYPATNANVALEALMADGSRVQGETRITASTGRIVDLHMVPADPQPLPQALEAIAQADLITIGPGSLFTSLIPNMLVHGVPEAIARSRAVKVFVCNLMTQSNESLGLSAADHIKAIYKHTAGRRIFDYALLNRTPVSEALKAKYALEGAAQIVNDLGEIEQLGVRPIEGDYLDETAEVARHATDRAARDLLALAAGRIPSGTPRGEPSPSNAARREHVKIVH
ncbi:MAG TPA: gluconeogenesis factor YvcK family protein [Terriglobales bacterium]|nr:gluconeogenesis factor YvcK family protein [Terriglobales bacterium]